MVNKLSHASLIGIGYGFSGESRYATLVATLAQSIAMPRHDADTSMQESSTGPCPKSEGPKPLVPIVDLVPLIASGIEAPWMSKYARYASSVVRVAEQLIRRSHHPSSKESRAVFVCDKMSPAFELFPTLLNPAAMVVQKPQGNK
ncbi:predicted protein [Histoplasma capsulatum H143]|uniref:Uncharacterized protein n=1 Tax=Ajellomyces capsulatus (strain H143) TaxID=544712 RepID=C6H5R7_AJECH|nr:predicted protein [Histoplasma capsulatum H143]